MKNDATYKAGPVCKSGAKILYAWAMDAPSLKLPPGKTIFKLAKWRQAVPFGFQTNEKINAQLQKRFEMFWLGSGLVAHDRVN